MWRETYLSLDTNKIPVWYIETQDTLYLTIYIYKNSEQTLHLPHSLFNMLITNLCEL